ncbi:MAG: MarR family transcriptional regulator, partial [Thermoleophilaceae bacterium]
RRTTLVTITEAGRQRQKSATVALTDIDFGLIGLNADHTQQLTALLTRVRRAAGDFTDPD